MPSERSRIVVTRERRTRFSSRERSKVSDLQLPSSRAKSRDLHRIDGTLI